MPFKCGLALQNIPLSKQPFKTQPQIENEDITRSPQYNLPATITTKQRALSLQEIELNGCISILHSWIDALDLKQPFNRIQPKG